MDNYHCTLLDAHLQTGIYGMHHKLGEGRNTPKLSFVTIEMYPKVSNTNQQILLAIGEGLWLSVGLHKRTRCCHPQWKCYRQLKSICAANHGDQCHRHQLLDYLHPNVPTCAAVRRLKCICQYAALSKNDLTIALLKTGSGPMHEALHEHCTDIKKSNISYP